VLDAISEMDLDDVGRHVEGFLLGLALGDAPLEIGEVDDESAFLGWFEQYSIFQHGPLRFLL
jgi:hypothetical protein